MANVLDDLTTLATTDRLLRDPRATGAGVRVAVVDSGIERDVLAAKHANMRPIEGGVFRAAFSDPLPYTGHQSAPHGTTVADVILTVAPQCELYSADVFGPTGTCEVETVVRALNYIVDHWGCKVVNLSLGVPESRVQPVQRRNALLRAVEEAYYRDVLVIAAAHNDHPLTRSFPAAFAPPLVSVDKGLFADPLTFAYRLRDQVEFQAHSRGYLGPFAAEPATSWAAPHVAGIAARMASLKPDIKPFEFKTLLYWMAQRDAK